VVQQGAENHLGDMEHWFVGTHLVEQMFVDWEVARAVADPEATRPWLETELGFDFASAKQPAEAPLVPGKLEFPALEPEGLDVVPETDTQSSKELHLHQSQMLGVAVALGLEQTVCLGHCLTSVHFVAKNDYHHQISEVSAGRTLSGRTSSAPH
jgi:hypothetical protein